MGCGAGPRGTDRPVGMSTSGTVPHEVSCILAYAHILVSPSMQKHAMMGVERQMGCGGSHSAWFLQGGDWPIDQSLSVGGPTEGRV